MALATGMRIGPYEVLSRLGAGGMGEVYQARDTRLNRLVALKILPSDKVADSDSKRRFVNEAQTASALNHPGIVTIYDISEQNGVDFIAMEYVRGKTLEQLTAGRGMPVKDAVRHASEIADALSAAHTAGIIHRDLKPANIMITEDGRVKVLDFGLAKLLAETEGAAAPRNETATLNTAAGVVMGTANYMSPEQAQGKKIDARSDIFSFGLVFFEMLSGQRAFHGESLISTLAAILHKEPRSLREFPVAIPPHIEQIVSRCLKKDPSQRYQSMAEVRSALAEAPSPAAPKEENSSIAVLPFSNLSADKENEYFSDGLAEEILNALTKVPRLRVIARTSAFAFRGKEHGLREIGEKLKVGTILEGSVRRAANRVRISAQLISVADESHLWAERYDREMTDVFAIQDEISQAIADALKVKLAAPQRHAGNIEAYQCYLKGLYHHQRYTPDGLAKARDFFEQALSHDPDYAPAYGGLAAQYYTIAGLNIRPMAEMAPLAKAAAEKALAIDPTLNEAHSVLGVVAAAFDYDWRGAERHFRMAMAGGAVSPLIRHRFAYYCLVPMRRIAEAVEQYRQALETDPLSMTVHFGLAYALYLGRQYEAAIRNAARSVDIDPNYWLVHFILAQSELQQGLLRKSIASFEKALELAPWFSLGAAFLAFACVRAGERGRAEELIRQVEERSEEAYVSPACFALYYAALGDAGSMFKYLEGALADRDFYLTRIDQEPFFDPFRSDARYGALLDRMNLGLLSQHQP